MSALLIKDLIALGMATLSIQALIKYSDEFKRFFEGDDVVQILDHWEIAHGPSLWANSSLSISQSEEAGYILLWNSNLKEFLLVEYAKTAERWIASFAPDPKEVLFGLNEGLRNWQYFFPLIREAHIAAHKKGEDQDLQYLERKMVDTLLETRGVQRLRQVLAAQANDSARQ